MLELGMEANGERRGLGKARLDQINTKQHYKYTEDIDRGHRTMRTVDRKRWIVMLSKMTRC